MFDHGHHSAARELDQFYTPSETARFCIEAARTALRGYAIDRVIEPSAGTGAFSDQLPGCIAVDIDPKAKGIVKADFLKWSPEENQSTNLVIGNPPFGKNASTAIQFFNHSAGFADVIAFIVPLSFRKASIQRRLDRRYHLLKTFPLENSLFLFEGKPRHVPCEFQIWERRNYLREFPSRVTTHADFTFCDRADADFAVQRIGANAGRIKDIQVAGSANSHFFIKAKGNAAQLRARFETINFDVVRNNTAGNPSVAKSELVVLYTQLEESQNPSCKRIGGQCKSKIKVPEGALQKADKSVSTSSTSRACEPDLFQGRRQNIFVLKDKRQ